jgi:hypothetical protein
MKLIPILVIYLITLTISEDTGENPENTQDMTTNSTPPSTNKDPQNDSKAAQQILIGLNVKQIDIASKCQSFMVNTNFKHVRINISKMKGISKIIFTDQPISECNEQCNPNAQICQSILYLNIARSVSDNSETLFNTRLCVGSIYIYPVILDQEGSKGSFEVTTDYINDENCIFAHQTTYAYCGESNLEECRNCQRQGCTIVECGVSQSRNVYIPNL